MAGGRGACCQRNCEETLKWGLAEDHPTLIALAFSTRMEDGVIAAKKLAPMADSQHPLSKPVCWRIPNVRFMSLEWRACGIRCSRRILWTRFGQKCDRGRAPVPPPTRDSSFGTGRRDVPRTIIGSRDHLLSRYQDGGAAMQVLIHAKSPLVAGKILALLKDAAANSKQFGTRPLFLSYRGLTLRGCSAQYRSREIISAFHDLVLAQPPEPHRHRGRSCTP